MSLTRSRLIRSGVAVALAIAFAGLDVTHGLAHHDAHEVAHGNDSHSGILFTADHDADHPHESVSQALRIRADVSDFIPAPPPRVAAALPATAPQAPVRDADPKLFQDRATGPPPRLRAPPID